MEDFILRFGAYMLLALVVSAIAFFVRSLKNRADLKALPEPQERLKLLSEIRNLKTQGKNHSACLQYLLEQGLRRGVAEGLLIDVEREQPPDLKKLRTFTWNGWQCEYPGNWKQSAVDEAIPQEKASSIQGIGSAILLFFKLGEEDSYEDILTHQLSRLKDIEETTIGTWASINGDGRLVKGVLTSHKLAMEMTVFHAKYAPIPFVVVESYALEEKDLVFSAFDLIHSTFKETR